jgi:hypothetical protein
MVHHSASPRPVVDDPWGEWSGAERPDAVEGEAERAMTAPIDDGAAADRGDSEDPDARS